MLIKLALLVLAVVSARAQQASHPQAQLQYRLAQAQAAAAAAAAAQEQTPAAQQQYAQQQYAQQQYEQPEQAQYAQPTPQPQYTAVDARQIARLRAAQAAAQGGRPATAPRAQFQPDPEDYDPNPQYQFSFDVKDDEFTNYQNRKEQREGGKISGSYSVVDSDGFIRTVKYTADPKEGFKAEVTREPTDIVVKIPQPPAPQAHQPQGLSATQRQLQTHQYLQGTLGVQPPQSQLYASLAHLPKRLPHAGAQAAPAPAPSQAPVRVQYVQAPSPARYTAPQAQQYSAAQAQQYAATQAQQYSPAQAQQYTAQQYQLASASSAAAAPAEARPIKAGAIGFATQEPNGGSVVYQAYQQ